MCFVSSVNDSMSVLGVWGHVYLENITEIVSGPILEAYVGVLVASLAGLLY